MDNKENLIHLRKKENCEDCFVNLCFESMKELHENIDEVHNQESTNLVVLERNYVLSLVYHMGKRKTEHILDLKKSNYFIGGEANKYINIQDKIVLRTCNDLDYKINNGKIEVIPDLLIHNSHNEDNGKTGEGQFLVMEVKTQLQVGRFAFMKDFFKLNCYISQVNFQYAIYLIINSSLDRIDELIGDYIRENYFTCRHPSNKILFFKQEKLQQPPCIYELIYYND